MKKDEMTPMDAKREVEPEVRASRRRLLTALTAGGAAAAFVPGSWTKPLVKGAILPAHAQTTPSEPGGGGGDCSINAIGWGGDGSFSSCVNSFAPNSCGGSAQVTVLQGSETIGSCFTASGGGSEGIQSWSCSVCASGIVIASGSEVTFVVEWENGCVCSVTRLA